MPDRAKVINELELAASLAWNSDEDQCEIMDSDDALTVAHAIRDALELLKEQEPITPKKQEETRIWIVCGDCSQHLISKWTYCPYCGKAVKWDD